MGEGGGTSLGLILAVAGIGTGAGPILARRFTRDQEKPMRLILAFTYPLMAVGVAVTAGLSSFGVVLLGTFVRAFAGGINWVFSTQLLLHGVSGPMRGRVFSTEFAFFTLTNAISTAIAGWALDKTGLGISGLLWWMAVLTLVPGILWVSWIMIPRENHSKI
jgi:predicted MFS family arabinose efflux permease